uniref:TATA box binding protein associated factor (TAF) histone-like fold domain-containing protein n=1 Tax=Phasianus colchicus TaxID=9054 RepID=A0A669QGW0_PHACC
MACGEGGGVPVEAAMMAEERRFAELPREAVRRMAEGAGAELSEEGAALLAEDVCYRLREAAQSHCWGPMIGVT